MNAPSLKAGFPNTVEGEYKRGCTSLIISSPSPLGKGTKGMGPSPPNRVREVDIRECRGGNKRTTLCIDRVCPEEYSSDTYNLTGSNKRIVSSNQSEGYSEN